MTSSDDFGFFSRNDARWWYQKSTDKGLRCRVRIRWGYAPSKNFHGPSRFVWSVWFFLTVQFDSFWLSTFKLIDRPVWYFLTVHFFHPGLPTYKVPCERLTHLTSAHYCEFRSAKMRHSLARLLLAHQCTWYTSDRLLWSRTVNFCSKAGLKVRPPMF